MGLKEFSTIWRNSIYYKSQRKYSEKLRFIGDFMLCDKETAARYLLILDGEAV